LGGFAIFLLRDPRATVTQFDLSLLAALLYRRIVLLIRPDEPTFRDHVALGGIKNRISVRARQDIKLPIESEHLKMKLVGRVPHRWSRTEVPW
jgi:hypothetical protein